jgi:hypothetical protein
MAGDIYLIPTMLFAIRNNVSYKDARMQIKRHMFGTIYGRTTYSTASSQALTQQLLTDCWIQFQKDHEAEIQLWLEHGRRLRNDAAYRRVLMATEEVLGFEIDPIRPIAISPKMHDELSKRVTELLARKGYKPDGTR